MNEYEYDNSYWVRLFNTMYENGIFIHHVSSEYESFKRYCEILKSFYEKYPRKKILHVVKLAEPSFGFNAFDSEKMEDKIFFYKDLLMTKTIHIVQWMWRGNLKNDNARISNYLKNSDLIEQYVIRAKKIKILKVFSFFLIH